MGGSISADECFGLRGGNNEVGAAFPSPTHEEDTSPRGRAERKRKEAKKILRKKAVLKLALKEMKSSRAAVMDGENAGSSSVETPEKVKASAGKPNMEGEVNSVAESVVEHLEESDASTADPSSESSGLSPAKMYTVGTDAKIVGLSFQSLPPRTPVVVDKIHHGTWASTTDISPGDELVAIDDRDMEEMQREEFMELMTRRPLRLCMVKDAEMDAAENEFFPHSFSPKKSVCYTSSRESALVFDMAANDGPRRHSCA